MCRCLVLVSTFPCVGNPKLLNPARGDLRIARQLIAFKRRCPERVWLLAGNRDINKLRLTAELNDFWRATDCAYLCLIEPKNFRYFLENEHQHELRRYGSDMLGGNSWAWKRQRNNSPPSLEQQPLRHKSGIRYNIRMFYL